MKPFDAGSSPDQPLQVTSRLVVLDVVVLDAKGNFVDHLEKSQFHITDDKQPETIRNFDPPEGHVMPSPGQAIVHSSADGYQLRVLGNDLHWTPQPDGTRLSEVTVLAVCYDKKDKELAQHAAQLKDELEAKDQLVASSRVGFAFPMTVPPGTARVRFVLRDAETGTMGSANVSVQP